MFFSRANKWEASVKKLRNNEITLQEFININENKILYYTVPFFENEKGQFPNALQTHGSPIMYFPAFSNLADLESHVTAIGGKEHLVIKGDLKGALDLLDSHLLIRDWGLVIDPHSPDSVGIPPRVRVQPKCLR